MNYEKNMQDWGQRRKEIADKKSKNVPIRQIAQEYGISTQRVYQILTPPMTKGKKRSSLTAYRRRLKRGKKRINGTGKHAANRKAPPGA